MNTTKKGDLFENRVFDYLKQYVSNGQSFLNPNWCQFFNKKGYYSEDRKSDIKVDISVESYSENADEWSLLLIVECKDLSDPVPVDDVEEFVAKVDQISGKNVKGLFFSTSGYQRSALTYAKSKGIGLIRMLPDDQVEWILRRTPAPVKAQDRKRYYQKQVDEALTNTSYIGQSEFIFGLVNDVKSTSLLEVINALVKDQLAETAKQSEPPELAEQTETASKSAIVPFIGQEELEQRTEKVRRYFLGEISNHQEIDLEKICDFLAQYHNVTFLYEEDLGVDSSGREILGKISTETMTVYISNSLEKNSHRWRYTVAHELGHLILHRRLDLPSIIGTHLETEQNFSWYSKTRQSDVVKRLEWQANTFASSLLLPREGVFNIVIDSLKKMGVQKFSHGVIFVDEQQCNIQPFLEILSRISNAFNASKTVVEYRLAQLRILNDNRKRGHVSESIAKTGILN